MRRLTSIVAVNEDGAIGSGNALPWRVRSDLRFFREQTEGNVVIMGRRTYASLGNRGLPRRKNIVVTHEFSLFASTPECKTAGSIDEALTMANDWLASSQEVFIVGGASMYKQFSCYVDRYLVTEIHKPVPKADTFLDKKILEREDDWLRRTLMEGKADGEHDEADFSIFEFVSKDAMSIAARRERVFQQAKERKCGNRLNAVADRPLIAL